MGERWGRGFQSPSCDPTQVPPALSLLPQPQAPQSMWHSSEGSCLVPHKPLPNHISTSPAKA